MPVPLIRSEFDKDMEFASSYVGDYINNDYQQDSDEDELGQNLSGRYEAINKAWFSPESGPSHQKSSTPTQNDWGERLQEFDNLPAGEYTSGASVVLQEEEVVVVSNKS
jgi:hypothetical protein